MNIATGHQFRFFDCALNGVHGRFDIYDNTFFETARRMRTDADDLNLAFLADLANNGNDFRRTDVETDD
jgi:hypothetical protein